MNLGQGNTLRQVRYRKMTPSLLASADWLWALTTPEISITPEGNTPTECGRMPSSICTKPCISHHDQTLVHNSSLGFPECGQLRPPEVLMVCWTRLYSPVACTSSDTVLSDAKYPSVGFVGLPLVAGFKTSPNRAVVQIEGTAFRVDGKALVAFLAKCPRLERSLQQYSQICAVQISQLAACNRLHEVHERLGRWLLMCADGVGSDELPLTLEFLVQMLGTRHSSVTVAAGIVRGRLSLSGTANSPPLASATFTRAQRVLLLGTKASRQDIQGSGKHSALAQ